MAAVLSCSLPLPANFRPGDVLAFHRRDPSGVTERTTERALEKGVAWRGRPARLAMRFEPAQAEAELAIDGRGAAGGRAEFEAMCARMLGLAQDVGTFERRYRRHPQMGGVIARQAGLRVAVIATPFEALTWAVTCQQISVRAGLSLRRRLIVAAGLRHSGGLLCYPDAAHVAALSPAQLREAGFSTAKAATLLTLSRLVADGALPLGEWAQSVPVDAIRAGLAAVRGIGPWTIDYTLLRGFGWLDGSLHGDVAVRRGLQLLLGSSERIDPEQARAWLAQFSPWRALAAAHLWAFKALAA